MEIENSQEEELELEKFYFNKFINAIPATYTTIEIVFRRSFPFAYPGFDGERSISHSWKTKQGNTYYEYKVCRHCFDVRKSSSSTAPNKAVCTCLCASCSVNPTKSRTYWDEVYTALCSSPLVGLRFEHCLAWKLKRVGIDNELLKVGPLRPGNSIQTEIRHFSAPEPVFSGSESDTDSYSLQTL